MVNSIILKLLVSWRLVTGLLLIGVTIAVKSPSIDRAFQESQAKEAALRSEQQQKADLEAQLQKAKLLETETEIAKTRILSGNWHRVWNYQSDPNAKPIQIKEGEVYYGNGSNTPLPQGTIVIDAYCGTGVVGTDHKLTDYKSAQGICSQLSQQMNGGR